MYKKKRVIRLTALFIGCCAAVVIYMISQGIQTNGQKTTAYIFAGLGILGFFFYLIQSAQFKGKLNRYFKEKGEL